MALIDKLNAIGNAIRAKTGKTEKLTLDQMPTEIQSIEGSNDKFWDVYQRNGERTNYDMAFAGGTAWTDEIFKPKYDIKVLSGGQMFSTTKITDLVGILNKQNVKFITEGCTWWLQAFQDAKITHIPEIDARSATNMSYTFNSTAIKRIDKLKVSATTPFNNTFGWELEYIIFEGEIGQKGLALRKAQLPKECFLSVVNCLSTTTSGLSVTLDKNAVNKAFETSEGANDGSNSQEWTDLIATRSNWTISLA